MFTAPPSDRGACWRRHDRTPRRSDRRWRGGRTKGREVRDSRLSNYPRRFNGWPARIYPAELADRRALTRRAQVGPHPLLVRGSEGRPEAQVRDGRHVPTFRDAYRGRRCILPADGFYEWMATKDGKRPMRCPSEHRRHLGKLKEPAATHVPSHATFLQQAEARVRVAPRYAWKADARIG
jgi:hypothetical protein